MKLLVDTDLLFWAAGEPGRLPAPALALIDDPAMAAEWDPKIIGKELERDDGLTHQAMVRGPRPW